jgi:hypothetical protein
MIPSWSRVRCESNFSLVARLILWSVFSVGRLHPPDSVAGHPEQQANCFQTVNKSAQVHQRAQVIQYSSTPPAAIQINLDIFV